MRPSRASSTARGTAATRARETEKPADVRICNDPMAARLAGPVFLFFIKLFARYGERRTHGALTFIACRQRYIDDFLRGCLADFTSQVVILGAGLDSRAYRDEVPTVKFFEIDHPATQAAKIRRLRRMMDRIPGHVTFVPVDFDSETLDKLTSFGFDASAKTLYIWEGVTPYLAPESVDATLAWVGAHSAAGSSIIFDYQHDAAPERSFLSTLLSRISGEVRALQISENRISDFLKERGFSNIVNVGPQQLRSLYCVGPNRNRNVPDIYSIASAEVAGGA